MPVLRRGLCGLAQPCLRRVQQTPGFLFHEATLLWIAAGRLELQHEAGSVSVDSPDSLLRAEADTGAALGKTPGGAEQRLRSLLLTLPAALLQKFHQSRGALPARPQAAPWQKLALDEDLAATLRHACESVAMERISDARLQYRLLELLEALAERGYGFGPAPVQAATAARLRTLLAEAPHRQWTAAKAASALAMSEATLRRRLAQEQGRFEPLLIDVRMHHALLLLQTTAWNQARIAQACGYRSSARFAERFRARFGYLPSTVR